MKSLANDTNIFVKFPTENYQRPPREIWRCDCCSNCSLMWPTFRSSSLWFCGSLPPKWSPGFNSLPVISRGLKSNSCKHETRLGSRKLSLSLSCMLARKKSREKKIKCYGTRGFVDIKFQLTLTLALRGSAGSRRSQRPIMSFSLRKPILAMYSRT